MAGLYQAADVVADNSAKAVRSRVRNEQVTDGSEERLRLRLRPSGRTDWSVYFF